MSTSLSLCAARAYSCALALLLAACDAPGRSRAPTLLERAAAILFSMRTGARG